jgi:NAD(P)-dependent dehydrogenase (short-subunit alcohol dehydrogenase family)
MMGSGLFRLDGKRALVTGAGRGIGRAVAFGLAEFGAQVTLCARTATEIEQAAEEIRTAGGRAEAFVQDMTDVEGFARTIATQPAFDILVNNAGTNRPKPFADVTIEDYRAVMDLNLKAVIFVTQAITRRMAECGTKGSVINMSSQMGHVGAANRTLYCASKWALEGFTRALAVELGPLGIRVNTICPTFIETAMTANMFADDGFRSWVVERIALGRLGRLDEIMGAVVFLAGDASSLMTGSALMLDGGWSAA